MNEFLVLLGLVLAVSVVQRILEEAIPINLHTALTRVVAVAVGAGLAWLLDYSVFSALGQALRADWLHPVMTGVVLVSFGEFLRSIVNAIAHRAGEPPVEATPAPHTIRAA